MLFKWDSLKGISYLIIWIEWSGLASLLKLNVDKNEDGVTFYEEDCKSGQKLSNRTMLRVLHTKHVEPGIVERDGEDWRKI